MQQTLSPPSTTQFRETASGSHFVQPAEPAPVDGNVGPSDAPSSAGFTALLAAFRATGGTARGDDVARLLEDHGLATFVGLARLIAASEVFGFQWRATLWIPMFQFDMRDLSVRPSAGLVLAELGHGLDDWARAAWFARPNAWLQNRPPVDLIETQLDQVLSAARTDRFIANG